MYSSVVAFIMHILSFLKAVLVQHLQPITHMRSGGSSNSTSIISGFVK